MSFFLKTIILFNCDIRACYGFVSIAGHACVVCSLQTGKSDHCPKILTLPLILCAGSILIKLDFSMF